jgi:hypothetical protein
MPKGPPPQWKRRDCRFDHLVAAAVKAGYGRMLKYQGIESMDRAHEVRRGIYRCARHRRISADAGTAGTLVTGPAAMGVRRTGETYELWYRVFPKASARRRHLERYGSDRQKWPYNPRRGASDAERQSWANRDETGRPVIHG